MVEDRTIGFLWPAEVTMNAVVFSKMIAQFGGYVCNIFRLTGR